MSVAPSKSPPRAPRIAALIFLGILALLVFAQSSPPPKNLPPATTDSDSLPVASAEAEGTGPTGTPPAADVAALLNGLSLGQEFEGWRVVNFFPTNRVVWIEMAKDGAFFSVGIGARGTGNPPPPVQTDAYEVGYGMMRPRGVSIPQGEMLKIAEQMAMRIRQREREVSKPAGL